MTSKVSGPRQMVLDTKLKGIDNNQSPAPPCRKHLFICFSYWGCEVLEPPLAVLTSDSCFVLSHLGEI